jgi:hypothetical protein
MDSLAQNPKKRSTIATLPIYKRKIKKSLEQISHLFIEPCQYLYDPCLKIPDPQHYKKLIRSPIKSTADQVE